LPDALKIVDRENHLTGGALTNPDQSLLFYFDIYFLSLVLVFAEPPKFLFKETVQVDKLNVTT
jgi:hypothetical protein